MESNINVQEKHLLVASCTPPTGDLAHSPGKCIDQESNWPPFGSRGDAKPTEPRELGLILSF